MYNTWLHIGPSCLPWAVADGRPPSVPGAPGTCPPRLRSPCTPCNQYYAGGYGHTPAIIPHGNRCPLGQFSCCENLLSQQTHVCYKVQPGMHSTVRAAGEHRLHELVLAESSLQPAHLSLCCLQQDVLG